MGLLRTIILISAALVTCTGCDQPMDNQVAERVKTLVADSDLVFSGTVEKLGASTMAEISVTDQTAIVNLDEILHAPQSFDPYWTGKRITIQLTDSDSLAAGDSAVFFAASWIFGSSLAVREVGHIAFKGAVGQVRLAMPEALEELADDALAKRLASAMFVLVGEVQVTQRAPDNVRLGRVTEHYPDWWEATISISSVVLGEYGDAEIRILYPNSSDVIWVRSPKFEKGQQGIWVLRHERIEGFSTGDYLTALDPLDFHTLDELERIERIALSR